MAWLWLIAGLLVIGALAGLGWLQFDKLRPPARCTLLLATLVVAVAVATFVVGRVHGPSEGCGDGPCAPLSVWAGFGVVALLALLTGISAVWWLADRIWREHKRFQEGATDR